MLMAALIVAALFFVPIPEQNQKIALVLLGVVIGWASSVVAFHFGSSQGSKDKTELMSTRPSGVEADPVHVEEIE